MRLYFVTPAWRRFELSAVCFEQRRRVMDELARHGIDARCVVIADDANLDLARALDFEIIEQDNEWLGRKFNDGIEWACRHGAEWVVPIGSDSWIDAAYFSPLPADFVTRTSALYCAVTEDRLAELAVRDGKGAGPYVINRRRLERSGFRPAKDELHAGIDRSTVASLGTPLHWRHRNVNPFQYVGFRGTPHLTPYEKLVRRWGVKQHTDPWAVLAEHYPSDLVERARLALAADAAVAA